MSEETFRNAPVRREYNQALQALRPVLHNLPPVIIVIDGRAGSGKTTLGRFLAWRFNVTLVETDLFLHHNKGNFTYKNDQIVAIIDHRIKCQRPIIVEGVCALRLLRELNYSHAFHVHLICNESAGSSITEREWKKYDAEFRPSVKADLSLVLSPMVSDP